MELVINFMLKLWGVLVLNIRLYELFVNAWLRNQ